MENSKWVYIQSEPKLYTVGFFAPDETWHTDSDWSFKEDAAKRVSFLNGCNLSYEGKMQEIRDHCINCDADERAIQPHEILDMLNE